MIDVKETLLSAEEKMEMGVMHLEEQLSRVRAGRANVAILDELKLWELTNTDILTKDCFLKQIQRVHNRGVKPIVYMTKTEIF